MGQLHSLLNNMLRILFMTLYIVPVAIALIVSRPYSQCYMLKVRVEKDRGAWGRGNL